MRRERLEHHGDHYDIPVAGGTGLGKPLKLMAAAAARRDPDLPRRDRAEGRRARLRDRGRLAADLLVAGAARDIFPLAARATGFDIAPTAPAVLTDDVESARATRSRATTRSTSAAWARRSKNFYNDLFARYGYEAEAREIQELFLDGKQIEAAATVPDAFVDEVALVGPEERIADRLAAWRESGATTPARLDARCRDAARASPKPTA